MQQSVGRTHQGRLCSSQRTNVPPRVLSLSLEVQGLFQGLVLGRLLGVRASGPPAKHEHRHHVMNGSPMIIMMVKNDQLNVLLLPFQDSCHCVAGPFVCNFIAPQIKSCFWCVHRLRGPIVTKVVTHLPNEDIWGSEVFWRWVLRPSNGLAHTFRVLFILEWPVLPGGPLSLDPRLKTCFQVFQSRKEENVNRCSHYWSIMVSLS